jgi:hypothetical protein
LRHDWLVVGLSMGAALAFAGSSCLKHLSAGEVPDAQSLHLGKLRRFVRATLSHRLFLGGITCDVVGLALQVAALHKGELTIVQPLLISSLLFALLLRRRVEHQSVSGQQAAWALTLSATLACFLLLASTSSTVHESADRLPAVGAGIVGALLAMAFVELGRRQRSNGRSAALMGIATGVIYAADAALLKALTNVAVRSPVHLLVSWQLYAVVVLGAAGLLVNQLAFQAGPITASLPATATIDPLLSIVIGVLVYDEHLRRGPGGGVLLIACLLLLGVTVIQLTRTTDDHHTLQ